MEFVELQGIYGKTVGKMRVERYLVLNRWITFPAMSERHGTFPQNCKITKRVDTQVLHWMLTVVGC